MPQISDKKLQKIKEHILSILYENHLVPYYTSQIAEEAIRDEEFTLRLLNELKQEGFAKEINKNTEGKTYLARKKWVLNDKIYNQYKDLSES
jgi:hypothetical protein